MSSAEFFDFFIRAAIDATLLLSLVLVIRKPFSKWFGSIPTYALWILPVLGFVLPRLKLAAHSEYISPVLLKPLPVSSGNTIIQEVIYSPTGSDVFLGLPFLLTLWGLIGFMWLVSQIMFYQNSYKSEFLNSTSAETAAHDRMNYLRRSINLTPLPRLRVSKKHNNALSLGLFNPMIILPQSTFDNFSNEEIDHILLHELMHIKRMDLWVSFGALIFRAVNWYNPLFHLAAHYFRTDMESACDACVLKQASSINAGPESYKGTLLKAFKLNQSK